jgi:hypothetical protein
MRPSARVLAGLALLLAPSGVFAQSSASANVGVTARVISAISIVPGQDLLFGFVAPGVNKTIAPDDATSGRFSLQGFGGVGVDITLTLPTNLTSGANSLPIDTWAGRHSTTDANGGTTFTPVSGTPISLTFPNTGPTERLWFRLGARVVPSGAQPYGDYTGTVAVSVIYTGI